MLAGAMVIVDALRSVGVYVPVLALNVNAPLSGVTPTQVVPYRSLAGAPVAVPNAWFGELAIGAKKSVAVKPCIFS